MSNDWRAPGIVDALRAALADRLTAGQAAALLNRRFRTAFSRNAVIGKALRLGILLESGARTGRPKRTPDELEQWRRAREAKRSEQVRIANTKAAEREHKRKVREVVERMTEPAPRGDVVDGCRWPCWGFGQESNRIFCGAPKSSPTSYCAFHRRMAFDTVSTDKANRRGRRPHLAEVA